jgi:uncharacterized protein YegL
MAFRCGLYNKSGIIQPLKSVDVNCTIREDFACQVKLTQIFKIEAPQELSVEVTDTDGDKIEFKVVGKKIVEYVNNRIELRNVTSFAFDCNTGKYQDNAGHGIIPAAERLNFARKISWLFEQCGKSYLLDIENEPEGGLKEISGDEIPKIPVETSYYFPLDGNAAVYGFRATLQDGTIIDGIVQEKNEAKQTFEKAKKQGKTAFLMEREKSDIFQISLGNVYANEEVRIEISYIAELEMREGRIRVRIPNRIAPKCGGGPSTNVNYPINFDFAIRTSTKIGKIEAVGNSVDLQIMPVPGDERAATVKASREGYLNEDLVLNIGQECPYGIYTTLERSYELKSECLRVTFNNPVNTDMDMDGKAEIIFLVDKSGSMSGQRMETTKFALTLFLRSLPENSKFNIVAFDSSFNRCFPSSVQYNDRTLAKAQGYVDKLYASGGTNVNSPLQAVLNNAEDPDYPRTIILLTDGEVSDTAQCISTARRGGSRVFSIGVGRSFSQELVEGLAQATNGTWLAVHNNDDMGNVVMQMLGNALKPVICKCKADLGPFGKAEMWPAKFPQIMDGVRTTMYWVRPMQEEGDALPPKFSIKLNGFYNNGDKFEKELQVITGDFEGISENQVQRSKQEVDTIIHRVAAMNKIKKLEKQRNVSSEVRKLGLKYNLATSETSFVAVRNNDTNKATDGDIDVIIGEIPSSVERDFAHSRRGRGSRGGGSRSRPAKKSRYRSKQLPMRHSMSSFMPHSAPSPQAAYRSAAPDLYRSMPESRRRTRGISPPTKSFKSASSNMNKKKSKKRKGASRAPPSRPQSFGGGFGGGSAFDQAISYHSANVNTSNHRGATIDTSFEKESSRDVFARNDFVKSYSSSSAKQVKAESKPSSNADWFEGVTFVPAGMSSQESAMVDSSNLLSEISQVDSFNDDMLMAELDDLEELEGGLEEEVLADFGAFQPVSAPKKVKLDFNWLLSQQKANGMFKFAPTDPRFTEYSKKSIDSRVGGKLKDKTMLKAVLATLFALAALESQFATRKTEWQFMFAKGKSFISKQLNDKSDFDGLLSLLRSDEEELNFLLA